MPVLRPLIGMDKDEITAEAQRLGTYPISIIPDQDCCTLFTPRHPVTRARRGDVDGRGARARRSTRSSSRRWPRQPWKSSTSRNKMSVWSGSRGVT